LASLWLSLSDNPLTIFCFLGFCFPGSYLFFKRWFPGIDT
jgi:hypothetical protein